MQIVFTTVSNTDEAENLARKIVESKLAACVQIVPQMISFYYWEGAVQKDSEVLLLIKTLPEKYDELERFIQKHHSYDVPEIVAVSAERVSAGYLNWMNDYLNES